MVLKSQLRQPARAEIQQLGHQFSTILTKITTIKLYQTAVLRLISGSWDGESAQIALKHPNFDVS